RGTWRSGSRWSSCDAHRVRPGHPWAWTAPVPARPSRRRSRRSPGVTARRGVDPGAGLPVLQPAGVLHGRPAVAVAASAPAAGDGLAGGPVGGDGLAVEAEPGAAGRVRAGAVGVGVAGLEEVRRAVRRRVT